MQEAGALLRQLQVSSSRDNSTALAGLLQSLDQSVFVQCSVLLGPAAAHHCVAV